MRLSEKGKRVAVSLAIAIGLTLVVLGVNASSTGRESQRLTPEIQSINPIRNATQVLQQSQVVVDLIDGYTGVLTVNNVEIETFTLGEQATPSKPGQQLTLPAMTIFEPGNYTLTFTPSEGAPIEKFATGINTVTVRYWKITDGPNRSKSFTWQFDVV